jgi:type I restriction enzyme, S subunit
MSELARGWVSRTLGEVARITTGTTPPTSDRNNYGGDIPFVKPGDLDAEVSISCTPQSLTQKGASRARIVRKGAVLVSCIGNLGKIGYAATPVVTNQQINAVEFYPALVDDRYGYFYCKTLKRWMESEASATTVTILNKGRFSTAPIVFPALGEQRRIAAKLDTLLDNIRACRARLDWVPQILRRFREAVLEAAVSGRLTEEWRAEHSKSNDWDNSTIGEVSFVTKLAGFEYTKFVKYKADGDLRVIKAENAGHWGFNPTSFSRVRSAEVISLTRSRLSEGDVLMVFVGAGTGRVARVPRGDDWFLGPNIAMIRPNPARLDPEYLEHYCRSRNGWDQIALYTKSVAQPSLSMKTIRLMEIRLPSLEEQTEIVRRIEELFALAESIQRRYAEASAQIEKLTPSVLAKAFRGELVPQDPNDEPAGEMLERIKLQNNGRPSARRHSPSGCASIT